jgi:hypothetical protein
VILSVWPFEMIGTAYLVTWLLARKLGKIWKIEVKREKKPWWKLNG